VLGIVEVIAKLLHLEAKGDGFDVENECRREAGHADLDPHLCFDN
jgi:hypothetical protein